jgi:voltage-gated potassium channel
MFGVFTGSSIWLPSCQHTLVLFIVDAEYLIVVRMLRVMRVFRILKLIQYLEGSRMIMKALRASRPKITVFVIAVVILVVIIGSLMYIIEGHKHGFSSIPMSIYWAVVTLTTVGYGDIAPVTPSGKVLASMVMIMGYAIIAVPTGIVTAELTRADRSTTTRSCRNCSAEAHPDGAKFCYHCGTNCIKTKSHYFPTIRTAKQPMGEWIEN